MMKTVWLSFLTLLFTAPLLAAEEQSPTADNPIKLVGLEIPWLLHETTPGPYNSLADQLIGTYELPAALSIQPFRRAMRSFFEGDADCLFVGGYEVALQASRGLSLNDLILSNPYNQMSIRAFTPESTEAIASISELPGKRVAVDLGVGGIVRMSRFLPEITTMIDALNVAQITSMLRQGRTEVALMMDYDYELYAARHPDQALLQFDSSLAIQTVEDAVMCKKSAATEALVTHVNQRISALSASGQLNQILHPSQPASPTKK